MRHVERTTANSGQEPNPKRLISEDDVERDYNIPKRTLQKRRFFNQPPRFVKIGRSARYFVGDIEAFLSSLPSGGGDRDAA